MNFLTKIAIIIVPVVFIGIGVATYASLNHYKLNELSHNNHSSWTGMQDHS